MVERHAGVAAVVELQPVEREMGLQEPTVFLSLDLSNDSLRRSIQGEICMIGIGSAV
jgi:hypothetical protein